MFENYTPQQLCDAIEIELQKSGDPKMAAIIAMKRLKENPEYYEGMKKAKDTSKLIRKQIIDKRGRRQTVWVKPVGREEKKEFSEKELLYNKYSKEKIDYPKDLIEKEVVGYRYGKAPEDEQSYNHRENKKENGVSMAKIGHDKESQLFATQNLKQKGVKKYYYKGTISDTGGDDEILLKNLKEISKDEFLLQSNNTENIDTVNKLIIGRAESQIGLIDRGWNLGTTKKEIKQNAIKQLKETKPEEKKEGKKIPEKTRDQIIQSLPKEKKDVILSDNFKNWFGDWEHHPEKASKVVDKNKIPEEQRPMAVYHGTSKGNFKKFDKEKISRENLYGKGFYFTENKEIAESYTKKDAGYKLTVSPLEAERKIKQSSEKAFKMGNITRSEKEHFDYIAEQMPKLPAVGSFRQLVLSGGLNLDELVERKGDSEIFEVFLNIRKPFDIDKDKIDIKMMKDNKLIFSGIEKIRSMLNKRKEEKNNTIDGYKEAKEKGLPYSESEYDRNIGNLDTAIRMIQETLSRFDGNLVTYKDIIQYTDMKEDQLNDNLIENGYDGLTHMGGGLVGDKEHRVWIAFEPNQIKSTKAEKFDPSDEDMTKAQGPRAGHKYYKRLPNPNPASKSKWIYFYTRQQLKDYQEKGIMPDQKKEQKFNLIETIKTFFGFGDRRQAEEKIKEDYKTHEIEKKFSISLKSWADHLEEYFKNKDKWDRLFGKEKTPGAPGGKKPSGEKKEPTGGVKKSLFKMSVMKAIYELYHGGPKVQPVKVKEKYPGIKDEKFIAYAKERAREYYRRFNLNIGAGVKGFSGELEKKYAGPGMPGSDMNNAYLEEFNKEIERLRLEESVGKENQGGAETPDNFDTMPESKYDATTPEADGWSPAPGATLLITPNKDIIDQAVATGEWFIADDGFFKDKTFQTREDAIIAWKEHNDNKKPVVQHTENGSKIEKNVVETPEQKEESKKDEEIAAREGYFNEKPAEVLNVGKDVWGAARHNFDTYEKLNVDISRLEEDGTAAAYVTKKNLFGDYGLANKDDRVKAGETEHKVLASYAIREYLAKIPGGDNQESRRKYMEFCRAVTRLDQNTTTAHDFLVGLSEVYANIFDIKFEEKKSRFGGTSVFEFVKDTSNDAVNTVGPHIHLMLTAEMGKPDSAVQYSMDKKERKRAEILLKIAIGERTKTYSYDSITQEMFGALKLSGIKVKKGDNIVLSEALKEKVYLIKTTYSDREKYLYLGGEQSKLLERGDFMPQVGETYITKRSNVVVINSSKNGWIDYRYDNNLGGGSNSSKGFLGMMISGEITPQNISEDQKKKFDQLKEEFLAIEKEKAKYFTKTKLFPESSGQVIKTEKDAFEVAFTFPDNSIRTFTLRPDEIKPENIEAIKRAGKEKSTRRLDLYVSGKVERKGGKSFKDISVADAQKKLQDDFKFKAVQYGNSMPDTEREYHTQWTLESFSDLSEILNIPLQQVTVNGKLGIAFGARGRGGASGPMAGAITHYEFGTKMINLTRANGFGSLAHEWGHFLDNILSADMNGFISYAPRYENKRVLPKDLKHGSIFEKTERARRGAKEKIVRYYFNKDRVSTGYPFARLNEGESEPGPKSEYATFYWYRNNAPETVKEPISVPFVDKANQISRESRRSLQEQGLKAIQKDPASADMLKALVLDDPYFNDSSECFARAFESYIADKLEDNGRKNTYLSSKAKTENKDGGIIYPQNEFRKNINKMFDEFFDLIRDSEELKKAIIRKGEKIFIRRKK